MAIKDNIVSFWKRVRIKSSDMFTLFKVGIGVKVPTNKLHIKDVTDPLKIEGLQNDATDPDKYLSIDSSNIVKYRTGAQLASDIEVSIDDLHGAGVDGAANQLLTDDGDGTVTSESTLTYTPNTLTIGDTDGTIASISPPAHDNGNGAHLTIMAGATTAGQIDREGGILAFYSGNGTGTGGNEVRFYTSPAAGSTGTSLNSAVKAVTITNDSKLRLDSGTLQGPVNGDLVITSDGNMTFRIDEDNDETSQSFAWQNNASTEIANLDESGNLQIDGDLTVSGNDIKDDDGTTCITFDSSGNTTIANTLNAGQLVVSTVTASSAGVFVGILSVLYDADNSSGPVFNLTKTRAGSTAAADDDELGEIRFNGENSTGTEAIIYAQIRSVISEADDTDEAGKLILNVTASDGSTSSLNPGLVLEGEHATGSEVDVTIANGAASTTTIAGTLTMGSTAAMTNAGLLSVANQSNITGVGTITSGTWTGTAIASAYLDSDTAHLSTTQTFTGQKTFTNQLVLDGDKNVTPSSDGVTLHVDAQDITDTSTSGSGTATLFNHITIENPRLMATNSSVTTTDASTVYIKGAPVAHTNQTITNAYSLYVAAGNVDISTVTAGTWNGDVIASAYLDADTAHLTTAQTFTGSKTMGTTVKLNFRDGNSYIYSPTANDLEIVATDIVLDAATSIALEQDTTVTGDFTVNGDSVTFESASADDPILTIKNTSDDTNDAAQMIFVKDRGAAPAVGTNIGELRFVGEDSGQNAQEYGGMLCEIDVATDGQESGQFGIWVATHDGELQYGLQITGGDAEDKVNVAIGQGAASTTTVAGDLTVTSKATIPTRKFTATSATHFEHQGDVLYFGGGSTTQGDLCYLKENGEWGQADADGAATGDDADRDAMGMLAIALGTDPDVDGMFIKGIITMDYDLGDVGNPVYISTTAGDMSNAVPGSGDFVRVVGYCLSDADGQMYFNPDNTWVEVA